MTAASAGPYTWARLVADFGRVRAAVRRMEAGATSASDERTTPEAAADGLPEAVALVQALRKSLGVVEADLVRALGRSAGKHSGELADGRAYEVTRGGDRTEWRHEEWKHDVRREVVADLRRRYIVDTEGAPDLTEVCLVDAGTGESMTIAAALHTAMTLAQEVHRAGPPKSTALKPLGLYAGDYSTTTPGPWRMTTTEEKTQ